MGSAILEKLELNIDIAYIFIGILVLILLLYLLLMIQCRKVKKLTKKYKAFMKNGDGTNLETVILAQIKEIESLKEECEKSSKLSELQKERALATYSKLGVIHYNAFSDIGGNLSFALALLNGKNTGIILNCIHSSDNCYTYVKKITQGEASITLTTEERQALDKAMKIEN